MLKAVNIHKRFGQVNVLNGIDLTIEKGEIVSIVGASGAGKTTLLQILGTLDRSDTGEILYNDVDVMKLSSRQLASFRNQHIGFIFQSHQLLPEFNAVENICIPAFIKGESQQKAEARANELLSLLGLSNRSTHKPSQLSGGEQQRVAVARSLINSPDVVFADEPSGNLDSKTAHELHDLFFRLRKELDQTFIIVTHNEQLADMADRKLLMRDGRIDY